MFGDHEKGPNLRICPVNSRRWVGDRFVSDCFHHQIFLVFERLHSKPPKGGFVIYVLGKRGVSKRLSFASHEGALRSEINSRAEVSTTGPKPSPKGIDQRMIQVLR